MRPFILFAATFMVVLNCIFLALQISLLRRRKPWPRALGIAACLWTGCMVVIFLLQALAPVTWRPFLRHWFYFPIAVQMIWNLLMVTLLVLIGLLVTLGMRIFRPVRPAAPPSTEEQLSRRKFVYLLAFGAAPGVAVGMGVHGTLTRHDLRVRKYTVAIPGLPPELEGFTIAHVSDMHSGIFCGPRRLKIISDAANDLKADLVAMTGDVINDHMSEFAAGRAAIQRIQSHYGTWVCEGNHDLIPGPGLFARACRESGLPLLVNETKILHVEGRRVILGGLPWMRHGLPEMVDNLFPTREEGDLRILLAHHPALFDVAQSADLVLTGHTHGGQIMAGPIGLGPLFFKYWSGPYYQGDLTMIVSNGCGDWFPCRIGAPAEIGLVRLTRKTAVA